MEQMTLGLTENSFVELLRSGIEKELSGSMLSQAINVTENKGYIAIKAKSLLAVKLVQQRNGIIVEYKTKYEPNFSDYSTEKLDEQKSRITLKDIEDAIALCPQFCVIAAKMLGDIGDTFGCCGRYEQCSDAKKCIHPDQLYALNCSYRRNLEKGLVFYGKNRNI